MVDICEYYENKIKDVLREYEQSNRCNYPSYAVVAMVLLDLLTDNNINIDEYMEIIKILRSIRLKNK